jgi:hypothetical protein
VRKGEETEEEEEAGRGGIDAEKQRLVEHAILATPTSSPPLLSLLLDTVVLHPLVFRFSFFIKSTMSTLSCFLTVRWASSWYWVGPRAKRNNEITVSHITLLACLGRVEVER